MLIFTGYIPSPTGRQTASQGMVHHGAATGYVGLTPPPPVYFNLAISSLQPYLQFHTAFTRPVHYYTIAILFSVSHVVFTSRTRCKVSVLLTSVINNLHHSKMFVICLTENYQFCIIFNSNYTQNNTELSVPDRALL